MYVADSQPNGWTDWAEVFLWALRGGRGTLYAKKIKIKFFPLPPLSAHKKTSAQSVQPFGRLSSTYIYIRMSCFII